MEMKKIIIDTNAFSSLAKGDESVLDELGKAATVYLSIFVLGEILAGFIGGTKEKENRKFLARFKTKPTVKILHATENTSELFARIKNTLKKAGTPIPTNDIWIAAHAIESGAQLITYDSHFKVIHGLQIWDVE
jgi:tRNA(fMet)-specific endonuclease VapC